MKKELRNFFHRPKKMINSYQKSKSTSPEEENFQRQKRIYNTFTSSTQYNGFSLFSDHSLTTVVSLVMILLQVVSFLTTWAGSSYFLNNIASTSTLPLLIINLDWLPPLIFAFSIQVVLLFVSNAIRRRSTILKWMVLFIALFCSTFTSYVGVYKTINPPAQYLEEEYRKVDAQLASINRSQLEKAQSQVQAKVNQAADILQRRYVQNEKELVEIVSLKAEIESIRGGINSSLAIKPPSAGLDYEEYVRQYQQYLNAINSSSGVRESEKNQQVLNAVQAKGYESENIMLLKESELSAQQANILSTMDTLSELFSLPPTNSENASAKVSTVIGLLKEQITDVTSENAKKLSSAYTAMLSCVDGAGISAEPLVNEEEKQQTSALLSAIAAAQTEQQSVISSPSATGDYTYQLLPSFAQMAESLNSDNKNKTNISDSDIFALHALLNTEIQKGLSYVNQFSYISPTIFEAEDVNAPEYTIKNMMLYPLYAFSSAAKWADAAVCLLFAMLFDGLTVMLALLGKKYHSILFARKNSEVFASHEDLAEEAVISTALLQSLISNSRSPNYAEDAFAIIADFIAQFRPTYCSVGESNFVYFAEYDEISKNKQYNLLLSFLLQFNYTRLIPFEAFCKMTSPKSSNGKEPVKESSEGFPFNDRQIILLRSNFVLWFTQKYSAVVNQTLLEESTTDTQNSPSAEEQAPDSPSAEEQAPDSPSAGEQAPDSPSAGEQAPESPSAEEQAPDSPSAEEQAPDSPSAEEQALDSEIDFFSQKLPKPIHPFEKNP